MIRWINKKIGTAAWSSVISVPDYFKLDVRELVDDYGNNNEHIANLIKNGIEILKEFNKLIICCEYGMSRSNAIAVAIISITENISFERSLECVINSVKENQIKLEVLKSVSEYLKQKRTEFKKSKNILLIDHNGFIAKRITKKTKKDNYLILSHGINFSILLSNPARLYLFICKNNVEKIVLISIAQITNTNSYVNNLLYFLKNILDVCTITLSKFIFLSSLDVYNGIKVKTLLLNSKSNQKKKPEGAKGIAFSLAEELIFYYQNKLNSNFSIIRIPTTYGHDKIPFFIKNFIEKAKKGKEINIHSYQNNLAWINLIHVNDLIDFIELILQNKICGIYNIDGAELLNSETISKLVVRHFSSSSIISIVFIEKKHTQIKINNSHLKKEIGWFPKEKLINTIKNL